MARTNLEKPSPQSQSLSQEQILETLRRPFRVIVFDWDGTAVEGRQEDATALAGTLEELLKLGVWIVIVTGTNFPNIDRQVCRLISPAQRARLRVCANRGSEVYGFDDHGQPQRLWFRESTPEEDRQLTAVADAVRGWLTQSTGLEVAVVYDRLNRRKVDLIPVPEWADPPKSRIGELLSAVEDRLRGAGLVGGLAEAIDHTRRLAQELGLPEARITSDAKNIEIGLTDKRDSMMWALSHIIQKLDIPMTDVLIAGDEFGLLPTFSGSDELLMQGMDGAATVSVGVEPSGLPAGVMHLPGGPAQFRALLGEQILLHYESAQDVPVEGWIEQALEPPTDDAWYLEQNGYHPALEHEIESRFTVANGFFGVRGSSEEPTRASRPRTFVAGLFDTDPERTPPVPRLISAPDWLWLDIELNGHALSPEHVDTRVWRRTLDLRRGVLLSEWLQRVPSGELVRLRTLRYASLADRSFLGQLVRLDVAQPTSLRLVSGFKVYDRDLQLIDEDLGLTLWRTEHSGRDLAIAPSIRVATNSHEVIASDSIALELGREWTWSASPDTPANLTRVIAIARGDGPEGVKRQGMEAIGRAQRTGAAQLLAAHTREWDRRWAASDVEIVGDPVAQRAIRFAIYHLIGAANPNDPSVSIAARSLTGDAYLGHVFWDTETFVLPFYTYTWPDAARTLLMYRYGTLAAARAKAARFGFRGAMYAWESADTGEEVTPPFAITADGRQIPIRCGDEEHHITADIAYAVWRYCESTQDSQFLLDAGAEILLETARFWASRADPGEDGAYHIRQVIGPDEYHEGVDDNAYTNVMAKWNIEHGLEVLNLLQSRWPEHWAALTARLGVTDAELASWRDVADRMTMGVDPASGVIEQFKGFFQLEPIDLSAWKPGAPMDVFLGAERISRSQVVKQADVVMLLALLWERFDAHEREINFRYYEQRCRHGSSLSPAMHALVAARLGDVALAERYFLQSAAIDLDDTMGNAAYGVHIASLGGLWQAVVFGFAGLTPTQDGLRFEPHLPPTWRQLRFPFQWQGRQVRIEINQDERTFTATLDHGGPLKISVGSLAQTLQSGTAATWPFAQ